MGPDTGSSLRPWLLLVCSSAASSSPTLQGPAASDTQLAALPGLSLNSTDITVSGLSAGVRSIGGGGGIFWQFVPEKCSLEIVLENVRENIL